MGNRDSKGKQQQENTETSEFLSRRKILKKAVYIAPTLIILGVINPMEASAQLPSGGPPPPPPPSQ